MKIRQIIIIATIAILCLSVLIYHLNKDIWDKNYEVLRKETLSIEQSIETVSLLEITPFYWDTVYFFKPYTPVDQIYETVRYKWASITETVSEGMNQIVFLHDGEVVCYVYGYPSRNGFGIFYEGASLKASDDNIDFTVTRDNGVVYLSKESF